MQCFVKSVLVVLVLVVAHSQQQEQQEEPALAAIENYGVLTPESIDSKENYVEFDGIYEPSTVEPLEFLPLPRIVGGVPAAPSQFPYQVSIQAGGRHVCGGSIISAAYVLSAAHCITRTENGRLVFISPNIVTIRAGSTRVDAGGVVVNVAVMKIPVDYRGTTNDVALLQVATPFTFDQHISPIALSTEELPNNAPVVTSGWGRISTNDQISPQLLYITLAAMSSPECSARIGYQPPSILCLAKSSAGFGACYGDSGGPAVYNNRLVGVTNFVVLPCGSNAPDGFARVSYFLPWIRYNSDVTA